MAPLHQVIFVAGYVTVLIAGLGWLWWQPLHLDAGQAFSAVAAIASAAAVWAAIDIARRAAAERRVRDAAKVVALRVLANGLAEVAGYRADPAKLDSGAVELLEDLRVHFESITVIDLPSPTSVDLYMLISTRLHSLRRAARLAAADHASAAAVAVIFQTAETDLRQYADQAESEAMRLLQGRY